MLLKNFHFIKNKKITLIIVAVVLVVGVLSFAIRGLNLDIDFTGGYELTVDLGETVTNDIAENVKSIIRNDSELGDDYVSSTSYNGTSIMIESKESMETEQQTHLLDVLAEQYPNLSRDVNLSVTSERFGAHMMRNAFFAVIIAVVLMLVYIAFRFEIASGLASIICLLHDLFVMLTVYSLFQIPISSSIIAAFLTILGYSINATIVVFDRIRENRKRQAELPFEEVVNESVHETMGRSFNTTLTTLLTIGAIFVACAITVAVSPTSNLGNLRDFSGTLIIGIVAGLFSSVFLSGMLWNALSFIRIGKGKKKRKSKG